MKLVSARKTAQRGTALLVALFLCMILAISIAGYMRHAQQQNRFSARSQSWNLSVAVSEAGIEEALQQLNSNTGNLTADGWAQDGSIYRVTRTLNPTTRYTVYLNMANPTAPAITSQSFIDNPSIAMLNPVPSTMFAAANLNLSMSSNTVSRAIRVKAGRSGLFLKAMVAKHLIDMNGNTILTDSFNSTSPSNSINGRYPAGDHTKLLDNGDVASNDTVANTVNVGNANIYGRVAVGPGGKVVVGSTGGVGTYKWQSTAGNMGKIQDGYFTDDMNFTFPKVSLPYTSTGLTPLPKSITKTTYSTVTTTDLITTNVYPSPVPATGVQTNTSYKTVSVQPSPIPYGLVTNYIRAAYTNNSYPQNALTDPAPEKIKNTSLWAYYLNISTNYTYPSITYTYLKTTATPVATTTTTDYDYYIVGSPTNLPPIDYYVPQLPGGNIFVTGNARLVVAGDLDVAGNKPDNQITLDTFAKLEMWVGGTSCKLSGNGVINPTGFAQNFICWCTDSVTDVSLNGNGEFTGVLIAPNGNVRLNGGGHASEDFIGCLLANNITLNGKFNFHYDEALRSYNGAGRFTITEWNEIPITQVNQY